MPLDPKTTQEFPIADARAEAAAALRAAFAQP